MNADPTPARPPEQTVRIVNLGLARPETTRILLAQFKWSRDDWQHRDGLSFLKNPQMAERQIERVFAKARQAACDLVVLPELSVPAECIQIAQDWSKETGSIVVAGTHYFRAPQGYISRCPTIIAGSVFFTEKLTPAPIERSPILGEGLQPGSAITIFRGSAAGNFAVLICADYLNQETVDLIDLESLDILCVPAFQRSSDDYYARMNIHCKEHRDGLYIVYGNALCEGVGDGRSAAFAVMDRLFADKLRDANITDLRPSSKILELRDDQRHAIIDIDLHAKKPFASRTVRTRPNVVVVSWGSSPNIAAERFAAAIEHDDERYIHVDDFYVPPREYDEILSTLDNKHIVFITGDPGIGKTYTAVRLLRQYFDRGYRPTWFAGLERTERLAQRQALDNFEPQEGQVIYFEDPFGHTVFESRDTLRSAIVLLIDILRNIDTRVIITSRREIFEQFSRENLSGTDLSALHHELNVFKPSYLPASLVQILERHARAAEWYGQRECRSLVSSQIAAGRLPTPLAIRDFVLSTIHVSDETTLLQQLERRDYEEKFLFAEDIISVDTPTKVALALAFMAGHQTRATLTDCFNRILTSLLPSPQWSGTAPFFTVLRRQTGYRLETAGRWASILRFTHPYYEEAFALAAEHDQLTSDILVSIVKVVGSISLWSATNAVVRLSHKYPLIGLRLCRELVVFLHDVGTLFDVCHFGSECLALHRTHVLEDKGSDYLDIAITLITLPDLLRSANREKDPIVVSQALRLAFNYRRALARAGKLDPQYASSVTSLIDWHHLYEVWRSMTNWAGAIDSFEWAARIDGNKVARFFRGLKDGEIYPKVAPLSRSQLARLANVVPASKFPPGLIAPRTSEAQVAGGLIGSYGDDHSLKNIGIVIDDGAIRALKKGCSLLPVGIRNVVGQFDRLDVVSIFREDQEQRIGLAITEYGAQEIRSIMGRHSASIWDCLGYSHGRHVIHQRTTAFFDDREQSSS